MENECLAIMVDKAPLSNAELTEQVIALQTQVTKLEQQLVQHKVDYETKLRTFLLALGESIMAVGLPPKRVIKEIKFVRCPDDEPITENTFHIARVENEVFFYLLRDYPVNAPVNIQRIMTRTTQVEGITPPLLAEYLQQQGVTEADVNVYIYYEE